MCQYYGTKSAGGEPIECDRHHAGRSRTDGLWCSLAAAVFAAAEVLGRALFAAFLAGVDFAAFTAAHGFFCASAMRFRAWTHPPPSRRRVTERSTATKTPVRFGVPGEAATATHAGPWLLFLRKHGERPIHFWPFDGGEVREEKSVVMEVYPALWMARVPME